MCRKAQLLWRGVSIEVLQHQAGVQSVNARCRIMSHQAPITSRVLGLLHDRPPQLSLLWATPSDNCSLVTSHPCPCTPLAPPPPPGPTVWPTIRTRLFSSFHTRADLINAVMASCHLPTLSDGSFTMRFKGRLHIDGGLLSVLTPPPHAAHTVLVCRSVYVGSDLQGSLCFAHQQCGRAHGTVVSLSLLACMPLPAAAVPHAYSRLHMQLANYPCSLTRPAPHGVMLQAHSSHEAQSPLLSAAASPMLVATISPPVCRVPRLPSCQPSSAGLRAAT